MLVDDLNEFPDSKIDIVCHYNDLVQRPITSGVAATRRFWFCTRGGKLQGGGKMRLRSAQGKQKKVKQENDIQRSSKNTLKNLKRHSS